jgi:hypothetical protein
VRHPLPQAPHRALFGRRHSGSVLRHSQRVLTSVIAVVHQEGGSGVLSLLIDTTAMIRRLLSITAVIVLALASLCLLAVSAFATLHRGKILRGPHANLLNERMDAVFRKVRSLSPFS